MATKKYKTVSGYLRSSNERMLCKIPWDASDETRIAAAKKGQRDILNHLLDQLELPILDDRDPPLDGINRLLALDGTERQVKALKDCQRWLKNCFIPLSSRMHHVTVVSEPRRGTYQSGAVGVTTPRGLVSYHVCGFKRDDHSSRVSVIVDADDLGNPFPAAEAIAGSEYCFHASSNISHPVPDAVKNRLLTNEELFAAVPELAPRRAQHATRR